ncbi:TetR/AcrR family transcriptional regulator [Microbacterium phosphatis]|uniref:TetR/AcrR family transcriptional regulator n=1 Tax=Microbacterium phosphatis TaxID=3140248 RepID=UPI00314027D1
MVNLVAKKPHEHPNTAPARPRGSYARSERTRHAIVEAAFDVFAERGYRSGSMREIAARAGVGEASIFHHFPAKQDLHLAVLRHRDELSRTRFALDRRDAGETLATLVNLAAYNATVPAIVRLYLGTALDGVLQEGHSRAYFAGRSRDVVERLVGTFEMLEREGRLNPGVEPRRAARRGLALWDGLQLQWLYDPESVDVAGELRAYFNGLLRKPL